MCFNAAGVEKRFSPNQAAPMARRCWKHSRQKTGRPWLGRNGTVVSFPHCEQFVLVSARAEELPPYPPPSARFADRKSTRLNSSHLVISYAVFCLKKKNLLSI